MTRTLVSFLSKFASLAAVLLLWTAFSLADPRLATAQQENAGVRAPEVEYFPGDSETQGSVVIDGETVQYTARAGTLPLADDAGNTLANVFYISYT